MLAFIIIFLLLFCVLFQYCDAYFCQYFWAHFATFFRVELHIVKLLQPFKNACLMRKNVGKKGKLKFKWPVEAFCALIHFTPPFIPWK